MRLLFQSLLFLSVAGTILGNVPRRDYVCANRLTNTITPLGRSNAQTFNHQGLLASLKDSAGQTASFSYDAKGRLTNRTDNVGTTLFGYDANNNVTNTSENGLTNSWTYDAYNRVSSCKDAYGNLIQYRYDANNNLTNLIYPGNRNVYYTYDNLNRCTNVTDWSGRITTMTYDLAGKLTSTVRPNGTQRIIGYDAAGQATNILEQTAIGFPLAMFRLNWNNAAEIQWEFAAPLPHTNAPPARTMMYDNDNRLAMVNGVGVAMDLNGNLLSGPLTNSTFATYSYDARNRLLNVGGVTNAYDPVGNRVGITYGSTVTKFVINPNAKLPQVLIRTTGGVTNYYIYGSGLLYEITETATTTNTLTYHFDYRGSTIALSEENGHVTDRMEYSAYASLTYRTGTNDTPFLFNGRYGVQTDPNGLLYMRARYYNPYLCRFINADPSGFSGGLNFYAYANGNPISLLDPFGLGALKTTPTFSWVGPTPNTDLSGIINGQSAAQAEALNSMSLAAGGIDFQPGIYQPREPSAFSIFSLGLGMAAPEFLAQPGTGAAAEGTVSATTTPRVVNAQTIQDSLQGSTMQTTQPTVSIPVVQDYVRMLESGQVAPPISVSDGVIVNGNHRYIAGRIFGQEPAQVPGVLSPSQTSLIQPIQRITLDPVDYGHH